MKFFSESHSEDFFRAFMLRGEKNGKICVGIHAKSFVETPKIILCIEKDEKTIASFELEEEDAIYLGTSLFRTHLIKDLWEENPWKIIGELIQEGPEKEHL